MDESRIRNFAWALLLGALLASCATLPKDVAKTPSQALPPAVDTPSAQYIDSERDRHLPDQSGFRLMTLSTNALMSRVTLADHAEHSLDLQYYIFKDDDTGKLIALHLLQAADRGVRVRLLLDDIKLGDQIRMFESLDAHPNIEVRLFNPFSTREPGAIARAAQMLLDFRRLNRRMHNKSFIADNKVAVVGGRNIADDYFGASSESNFRDLDLLCIGPVVQQASKAFDSYWNDAAAIPVSAYSHPASQAADLPGLRATLEKHVRSFSQSDYAQAVLAELPNGATADRQGQWYWGSSVLVADQPEKIQPGAADQPDLRIGPALHALINGATSEVLVISPYFVPSNEDEKNFIALAKRDVKVRVLTNSLASTDEPAVHTGYAAHRHALLAGGVDLFELKPEAGTKQTITEYGGSSGVSLHAKSFVVDRRYVFIGSMNMDERSKLLNTEMGVVVDSPSLAKAVAAFFETVTLPANSYQLGLEGSKGVPNGNGQLLWTSAEGSKTVTVDHEPGVGPARRAAVLLLKMLPIDSLL